MSETGEGNAAIGKSNFYRVRQSEGENTADVHKSILDEIDGDKTKGEKGNWKGTLSRFFKNKEGHEDGMRFEENGSRKTSSLGKIFRRSNCEFKKDSKSKCETTSRDVDSETRPRRSKKGLGHFLKKWPFKSEQNSPAGSSVKPTSPVATVEN